MYKLPINQDWSFLLETILDQVCIGQYNTRLHFNGGAVSISINYDDVNDFMHHKTKSLTSTSVEGMPKTSVTLISLLGASVDKVIAENITTLALFFNNNEELRIFDCSDAYESFTITSSKGIIIV
jgi:hypothetical protein